MAGLMTAPQQPQAAPEEEQAANVTPEEQALYEELVARGTMLLYDGKTKKIRAGVLEMMQADPEDPAACLGEAAGTIMSRVEEVAAEGGVPADRDMLMQAGAEIFEQVAEAATAAGVHDFEQDDEAFQRAYLIAVDTTRTNAQTAGRIDAQQEQADFAEVAQADKDGRLDEIMRSLGGQAGQDQAPPEEPPARPGLRGRAR